ncbi:unnamed protein product [Enterobius vermicularis]|uniref:Secreted protein n=1 Tax=Enterobius vermicularis TaxID=51028 RepID=A0A0N4V7C3_ENTVE|nr:unnamed protein product [Enterobius vermicularis]
MLLKGVFLVAIVVSLVNSAQVVAFGATTLYAKNSSVKEADVCLTF